MIKSKLKYSKDKAVEGYRAGAKSIKTSYNAAPLKAQKIIKRGLLGAIVLLVVIASWKFGSTYLEEKHRLAELAAGPQVKVALVTQSPGDHTITLIGETRPFNEATLYAKVSGYLKAVKVDKGDQVKAGQLLAVIESPETDQAYDAALADSKNKSSITSRMEKLFERKLVSQQEMDQSKADSEVATARLRTAETLKSYEYIKAPFAGTVTSRYADPGALVQNATNAQTSALPLVTVSTIDQLRVAIFVDQHEAQFVFKDEVTEITLSDRPGFKVPGKVSRVSGELDPRTKMLLTEVDLDNSKHELVAGSFVQVSLRVQSPPYREAPVGAMVMKDSKPNLTVITKENKITFKPIEVVNNDGKMVWFVNGVEVGEKLALNIADTVPEGGKVRPVEEGSKVP